MKNTLPRLIGVRNHASKLYAIYANPEHVHLLISRAPELSDETLATIICDSSEKFINKNRLVSGHFTWQQSATAFSVSKSSIDRVCKYILNPPEHHKHETFSQEYEHFLKVYQANFKIDKIGLWGDRLVLKLLVTFKLPAEADCGQFPFNLIKLPERKDTHRKPLLPHFAGS